MDIEYVRSRFIKHFDGTTGSSLPLIKSNNTEHVSVPNALSSKISEVTAGS